MKAMFILLAVIMGAACTEVEQRQNDDQTKDLASEESVVSPRDGGPGAACGTFGTPPCASGLFCVVKVCRPPGGPGAACGTFGTPPCASGLTCVVNVCR